MSFRRPRIELVPLGDPDVFERKLLLAGDATTLRAFLSELPALTTKPFDDVLLEQPLERLRVDTVQVDPHRPLYQIPGVIASVDKAGAPPRRPESAEIRAPSTQTEAPGTDSVCVAKEAGGPEEAGGSKKAHPDAISEKDAVGLAYAREIESAASFLRSGLSILLYCDKLVVEPLWQPIVSRAQLEGVLLTVPEGEDGGLVPRGMRQRQLAELKMKIQSLKDGHVLVIRHLDLLAGGSDANLPTESRELIELVYEASDRLMLAFTDRSIGIPEVLAARFAVRLTVAGISRTVVYPDGDEAPIGRALVTNDESRRFEGFDSEGLYKNVAGLNPIRLRDAIRYAVKEHAAEGRVPVNRLYQAIRAFKAQTSAKFEVPDVRFEDIGGYEDVKHELLRALRLMQGAYAVGNDALQRELMPRGFIFWGPPGTGKTLFAKAVANQLNATIQVVSGPEVTDMYVGESERKVRELFAEARRNAPAVLVFDEFDSIATKRSGRDDGGSRAGNALVAQILTEMDGFRPDVPMLVIGTTNRLDIIDPAMLRPSRFKAVAIGLPNPSARRAIAEVHARHFGIPTRPELLEVLAKATEGMNGDDIRSIFRDARVAELCDGTQPDAHFLGKLVGRLRLAAQQQQLSASAQRSGPTAIRDDRPRPTDPMMSLIRTPSSAGVEETPAAVNPDSVEEPNRG